MFNIKELFLSIIKARAEKSLKKIERLGNFGRPHQGTFRAGRNAEKRRVRESERLARAAMLEMRDRIHSVNPSFKPVQPIKNRHLTREMIDVLANRRLRQRGVSRFSSFRSV